MSRKDHPYMPTKYAKGKAKFKTQKKGNKNIFKMPSSKIKNTHTAAYKRLQRTLEGLKLLGDTDKASELKQFLRVAHSKKELLEMYFQFKKYKYTKAKLKKLRKKSKR